MISDLVDIDKTCRSSHYLISALCSASAYNHPIEAVKVIETHISWVLLTGQFAYKIKKPVHFNFLDFTSLAKRLFCCQEELRLNRRLSDDIYLDVVPITGSINDPKVGGTGEVIEYAVKMTQFSEGQLLSERAEAGFLTSDEIIQIANNVAKFHGQIERAKPDSPYDNNDDIKFWFDENFSQIGSLLIEDNYKQQLLHIQQWGNEQWFKLSGLMQLRKQQGFVRECHGDLHLGNMTLVNGKVELFDCIDFNPSLRWIDVLSEVAFVFIDLFSLHYDKLAFSFLNLYLQATGDYPGLAVFRFYLVYRALVRAKVYLLRRQQCESNDLEQFTTKFSHFMNLAEHFTKPSQGALLITHGYSGSGKSTFTRLAAENIGALQIRSDCERKRLFGYHSLETTGSDLNCWVYSNNAGEKTYECLRKFADTVLQQGFSVLIDATFLKKWQRDLFKMLAEKRNVSLHILDFQVDETELIRRIEQRTNDASEATVKILEQQKETAEPLTEEERTQTTVITQNSSKSLKKLFLAIKSTAN